MCEFGGAPCFRLVPKVTYTWNSNSEPKANPRVVTAFYRLDLRQRESTGRDLAAFGRTPISAGFAPFLTNEKTFHAVKRDKGNSIQGEIDNFHDIHAGQGVHVPGCRRTVFDCFHMHWRWNGPLLDPVQTASDPLIDVLVEPSDDGRIDPLLAGTPYLVSGQKIDIGIVKFNSAEQKFLNPSSFERPNADPFEFCKQ